MNAATEDSRTARRDPKSQSKQTAGARDGTAGSQQARRGGKSSQNVNRQPESATNGSTSTPQPPQEEHVPLNGFNAAQVEAMLQAGIDPKAPVYKPESKGATATTSPWGTKAGAMANGKDFWLELRKQTTQLLPDHGERRGG